ncbi:hypothetical protein NDU88_001884 [Pleurodeles waltl]|uniref:Uncharacterized protein n=1 Tax=Pleurodeles waltl TaxID=8319 RepID=A0AAV7T1S6_PLEWA|nr:hypothetical protein NDU88_001884 [Pleurodeles waltl]
MQVFSGRNLQGGVSGPSRNPLQPSLHQCLKFRPSPPPVASPSTGQEDLHLGTPSARRPGPACTSREPENREAQGNSPAGGPRGPRGRRQQPQCTLERRGRARLDIAADQASRSSPALPALLFLGREQPQRLPSPMRTASASARGRPPAPGPIHDLFQPLPARISRGVSRGMSRGSAPAVATWRIN